MYHKGSFLFGSTPRAARRPRRRDRSWWRATSTRSRCTRPGCVTPSRRRAPRSPRDQARMLKRWSPRVALTYDGDARRPRRDDALARHAARRGTRSRRSSICRTARTPTRCVKRGGADAWRGRAAPRRRSGRSSSSATCCGRPGGGRAIRASARLQAVVRLARRDRRPDPAAAADRARRAAARAVTRAVLARAIALAARRRRTTRRRSAPRVRALGHTERTLERRLLRALLHAPGELGEARQRLSPEDFRDAGCAALALALWSGAGRPTRRRRRSSSANSTAETQELDWAAEARGGVRRMVERRLLRQLQERRQQLHHAPPPEEAERLMQEIDELARSLRDLSA